MNVSKKLRANVDGAVGRAYLCVRGAAYLWLEWNLSLKSLRCPGHWHQRLLPLGQNALNASSDCIG